MSRASLHSHTLLRDLGDGLVLRRATPADAEALAEFNGLIHRDPGVAEPATRVAAWTRDLMAGTHPTFRPEDFTVVQDSASGSIVSSLNLISQTWSYGGIEFGVGRPELVGTLPPYRRRGLVRSQMEIVHAWSSERGELAQAITGIPYYYRQFGYDMALNLIGGRVGSKGAVPALPEGQVELFRLRPTTEADLPFWAELYREGQARSLVTCLRDPAMWQYELSGKRQDNVDRYAMYTVETPTGDRAGVVALVPRLWHGALPIRILEIRPGLSWLDVTPSVLRGLAEIAEAWPSGAAEMAFLDFAYLLGEEHPLFTAYPNWMPRVRKPYAFYVRVPDVPVFVNRIAPVLEERLARSVAVGHSGELRLSFYRSGLRLVFERGRIASIEPWMPGWAEDGDAAFPDLTFLQLLFGYRTLDELCHAYADCMVGDEVSRALLQALFPKHASNVWPIS